MYFKDQNVYYVFVAVACHDYEINLLMILFVFLSDGDTEWIRKYSLLFLILKKAKPLPGLLTCSVASFLYLHCCGPSISGPFKALHLGVFQAVLSDWGIICQSVFLKHVAQPVVIAL